MTNVLSVPANVLKPAYNQVEMANTFGRMRVQGEMQRQAKEAALRAKSDAELEKEFKVTMKVGLANDRERILKGITEAQDYAAGLSVKYGGWDLVPPTEKVKAKDKFNKANYDMELSAQDYHLIQKATETEFADTGNKLNRKAGMSNRILYMNTPFDKRHPDDGNPDIDVSNFVVNNPTQFDIIKDIKDIAPSIGMKNYSGYGATINGYTQLISGQEPDYEKGAKIAMAKYNSQTDLGEAIRNNYTPEEYVQLFNGFQKTDKPTRQFIAPDKGDGSGSTKPRLVPADDFDMPVSPENATSEGDSFTSKMTNVQDVENVKPFQISTTSFKVTAYNGGAVQNILKLDKNQSYKFAPNKVGVINDYDWYKANTPPGATTNAKAKVVNKGSKKVIYGDLIKLSGDNTELSRTTGWIPYDEYYNKLPDATAPKTTTPKSTAPKKTVSTGKTFMPK
jgi:hypothetical protein